MENSEHEIALQLFNADPELKEALADWFQNPDSPFPIERMLYLRSRAIITATKLLAEENEK